MVPDKKCPVRHCSLPEGHDGLHQAVARVYDLKPRCYQCYSNDDDVYWDDEDDGFVCPSCKPPPLEDGEPLEPAEPEDLE